MEETIDTISPFLEAELLELSRVYKDGQNNIIDTFFKEIYNILDARGKTAASAKIVLAQDYIAKKYGEL